MSAPLCSPILLWTNVFAGRSIRLLNWPSSYYSTILILYRGPKLTHCIAPHLSLFIHHPPLAPVKFLLYSFISLPPIHSTLSISLLPFETKDKSTFHRCVDETFIEPSLRFGKLISVGSVSSLDQITSPVIILLK